MKVGLFLIFSMALKVKNSPMVIVEKPLVQWAFKKIKATIFFGVFLLFQGFSLGCTGMIGSDSRK